MGKIWSRSKRHAVQTTVLHPRTHHNGQPTTSSLIQIKRSELVSKCSSIQQTYFDLDKMIYALSFP